MKITEFTTFYNEAINLENEINTEVEKGFNGYNTR